MFTSCITRVCICVRERERHTVACVCVPLFQGMINLVLECIDRLHVYSSAAHFSDVAGKEAGEAWKSILNSLYELLGEDSKPIARCSQHNEPDPASSVLLKSMMPVLLGAPRYANRAFYPPPRYAR